MSATLFIGAVGLTINCALAVLALRMVMRFDQPPRNDEPVAQPPAAPQPAAAMPCQPAQA